MTTAISNSALGSTALDGTAVVPPPVPAAGKKRGWMPLLTVLFLISYGLMTLLIVEQGLTIENQRALIRDLFRDSAELSAIKGKAVQENMQRSGQTKSHKDSVTQDHAVEAPANPSSSSQAPSNQTRSNQTRSNQTPSTNQAGPQQRAQTRENGQKPRIQTPSRPASDLADERRSVITI